MAKEILTRIVLRNDESNNWTAANTELKRGEVGIEFTEDKKAKLKIGDGETGWNDLGYFGGEEAHVFQCSFLSEAVEGVGPDASDEACIERYTADVELHEGDMAIVKKLINGSSKYSYTSYVYDDGR